MRRVTLLIAAACLAGCGANYASDADLPRLNPGVCAPCSADSDCGPGAYCAAEGDDPPEFCTAPCDANGTCPDGQTCDDFCNGLSGCYPSSNSCKNVVVAPTAGAGGGDGATTAGDGTTTAGSSSGSIGTTTGAAATTTGTTGTTGTQASSSSSSTGTTGTHSSSTSGSTSGTSGTTGNTCTPDTWATTMHSFFNQNCNGCHNFTSVSSVRSEASSIKSRISSGSMPQGRSLSTSQKNAVIAWINCGEP